MKYACELVQDLYPLYVTGDLSSTVRNGVEEHLQECDTCRNIYETGEGFNENRLDDKDVSIPKSLDNQIRLSMKLRRMKLYLTVLISVILIIIVNVYQNQRHEVFSVYEQIYRGARELNNIIDSAPEASDDELGFLKDMYFQEMYEGVENLSQSLNWLEQRKLKGNSLYIQQEDFYTTLDNLNLRKSEERWDDVDQKTYDLLHQYASEYMKEVEEDYRKFNDGYSSYFEMVDVKDLSKPLKEINKLTYIYNRFHKLPNQVEQLNEDDLKKQVASIFNIKQDDVKIEKDYLDYHYRFTVENKNLSGELDAFSGYPIQIDYYGKMDLEGELLDVNQVQENVMTLLKRIYGEDKQFAIDYLGINVNYSSNVDDKLYTFAVMPTFESNPVYAFSNKSITVYFDARSGELRMFYSLESVPLSNDFQTKVVEKVSPEEGLKRLNVKVEKEDKKLVEKRNYQYIYTFIIYSSTSGGLVPVHAYGLSNKDYTWRYINIENGKEELLYFND